MVQTTQLSPISNIASFGNEIRRGIDTNRRSGATIDMTVRSTVTDF